MPVHDWTRVDSGTFHHFHQAWMLTLCNALNGSALPESFFAMVEQRVGTPIADVLTLELANSPDESEGGAVAVATAPPRAQLVRKADPEVYARRTDRISIRHRQGKIVAVIELVSPGNKHNTAEFRAFVEKSADLVQQGVHLLVIDLFPPTRRDPSGMAKAIWDEFNEEPMDLPPGKPMTISSIDADQRELYVNFAGVGDVLPDAPIFLRKGLFIHAPLAASYEEAWKSFPKPLKRLLA